MANMSGNIISINIGKPALMDYNGKEILSGINKKQVDGPIFLDKLNFAGDGQADLIHHGGADKAVCVYSFEHYSYWEQRLNRKLDVAAFGENLTIKGMLESDVAIGDIFQIGEAVVQVSQPRQPCYKLAARYGVADLPVQVERTGYTGYYFRVLKAGWITSSAAIVLKERHPKQLTVEYANEIMHHDKNNIKAIKEILSVNELSKSWQNTFTKRLNGEEIDRKLRVEGETN